MEVIHFVAFTRVFVMLSYRVQLSYRRHVHPYVTRWYSLKTNDHRDYAVCTIW